MQGVRVGVVGSRGRGGRPRRSSAVVVALGLVAGLLSLVAVAVAVTPAPALAAGASGGLPSGVVPVATNMSPSIGVPAHSCALTSTSGVQCWGRNTIGQLGATGFLSSTVPVDVTGLSSGVRAIEAGLLFTCALTEAGQVKCWGTNSGGELGDGTNVPRSFPAPVSGITSATAIESGNNHSCAIVSNGGVKCWGQGTSGRLGNGASVASSTPVDVLGFSSGGGFSWGATAISLGGTHSCALTSAGAVKCWGLNNTRQLANGTTISSSEPVDVLGLSSGVSSIAAGTNHTCAVLTSGSVKCWGLNSAGQLGAPGVSPVAPIDVAGLTDVIDVGAGFAHTCALRADGTVACWGANADGQLGDGTFTNHFAPTTVPGLDQVVAIAVGGITTCALRSDGKLLCWGSNASGQLGTGDISSSSSPVAVSGGPFYGVAGQPTAFGQSLSASRGVGNHIVLEGTDPTSRPLTFSVVTPPTKGVLDCNGSFGEDCVYTPDPGETGEDSFQFTASNGTATSDPATVALSITNDAPTGDAIVTTAQRTQPTQIILTGSDRNGDVLTFSDSGGPGQGTVSCQSNGVCTYTSALGARGTDSFDYTVSDGTLTGTGRVTIHLINDRPVADDRGLDAGIGDPTPLVLSGSDANHDDLSFRIVDQPTQGSVSCEAAGSPNCTYTSARHASGTDSFTYVANDADVDSPLATVTITLLQPQVSANDQSIDAPRGIATPIVLSGVEAGGGPLTFAVADGPAKGTLQCSGPAGADCTYLAGPGQSGSDEFTFTASNGTTSSKTGIVSVTITNQAPNANAQTLPANAPTTATPITLTASDPNGDAITYAKATDPTKGTLSCTGASCTYVAFVGRTGTDSFTFTASDSEGQQSTGTVTLHLDNVTPGVFVGGTQYLESESGNATYRSPFIPVMLSSPAVAPVTVWYYTVNGTAVTTGLGGDYRQWGTPASPRSITIAAGQSTGWIQPPVFDDDLLEGTEQFRVVISSLTGGASYLGNSSTTVDILDADSISVGKPIAFIADVDQAEGNTGTRVVGFRILLSKAADAPVTFTCTPTAGTAVAGSDFRAGAKTVTINAGAVSGSVDIAVYANVAAQPDRSFSLVCVPSGSADITALRTTAVATLHDDD